MVIRTPAVPRILSLTVLSLLIVSGGIVSCKKAEEPAGEWAGETLIIKEGLIQFAGKVKVVLGKYVYIPEVQGFDLIVQGALETGDISSLAGKEVRGAGEFSQERPSILVAKTIEVKNEGGIWQPVFTGSEEFTLDDYLDLNVRAEFPKLGKLSYDKKEGWEGKDRGKVLGRMAEESGIQKIVVLNDDKKELGKIIVGSQTDFSRYYIQKLRLFDTFWFYLKIKDTVDMRDRRKTREMFHADVVFAGLF